MSVTSFVKSDLASFLKAALTQFHFQDAVCDEFNLDKTQFLKFLKSWDPSSKNDSSPHSNDKPSRESKDEPLSETKDEPLSESDESSGPLVISPHKNAFLITGNTKTHKELLSNVKCKWNPSLKGWIFPKSKKDIMIQVFEKHHVEFVFQESEALAEDSTKKPNKESEALAEDSTKKPQKSETLVDESAKTPKKSTKTPEEKPQKKKTSKEESVKKEPAKETKESPAKFIIRPTNKIATRLLDIMMKKWEIGSVDDSVYTFEKKDESRVVKNLESKKGTFEIVDHSAKTSKKAPVLKRSINEWKNVWNKETGIVFEKEDGKYIAIGTQTEDGEVVALEDDDINACKQNNWEYREFEEQDEPDEDEPDEDEPDEDEPDEDEPDEDVYPTDDDE